MAPVTGRARPVVYLGPSLGAAEAATIVPDAYLRPPANAGDLYRARKEGASLLLIVDGQFLQEDALPPREVVDVVRDGATVVGASSLGALRAAECWPAGMRGVGVVYRLFRQGRLDSDDEVAVATDPDRGYRATSVALVNVRYAVSRAVRAGLLDRPGGRAVVGAARRMFYPDRTWRSVLSAAGCATDGELARFCRSWDLKADDARRALRLIARRRPEGDSHPERARRSGLGPTARQPLADAVSDQGREAWEIPLTRWMVGSGRLRHHPVAMTALGTWAPLDVDDPAFARWIWDMLESAGELDAELMRLRSVEECEREASRRGLRARAADRYLALMEIAARYGCASWDELAGLAPERRLPWDWIDVAAARLALAKRVRAELFGGPGRAAAR